MDIDPYRLVVFLHVVLFAYWLGADLGVFICGRLSRRQGWSEEARQAVRRVGHLIDMGPRTALVLMVPAGLTLAAQYGSPIQGPVLLVVWAAACVWLWMVWTIFLRGQDPFGKFLWKIDVGLRCLLTVAFIGSGVYCLATGTPVSDRWLAAKMIVFGLILLDGIALRLILLWQEKAARDKTRKPVSPRLQRSLIYAVLLIWVLVAAAAFLGIVKPI